jgi:hypothetical protein
MNDVSREREGSPERVSRFFRNINALGAVALGGLAVLAPGPSPILAGWAGINAVQAGGFEAARRYAKKRRLRKNG